MTHVDPTRAQFDAFKTLSRDHPIDMLNLVRLRKAAVYPAEHTLAEARLSGAEAYKRYGRESAPVFQKLGGQIVWRATFETCLIGPDEEHWDHMFIARYPTAHAFLAMVTDTTYKNAVVHRQAAVATSRLLRSQAQPAGDGFA